MFCSYSFIKRWRQKQRILFSILTKTAGTTFFVRLFIILLIMQWFSPWYYLDFITYMFKPMNCNNSMYCILHWAMIHRQMSIKLIWTLVESKIHQPSIILHCVTIKNLWLKIANFSLLRPISAEKHVSSTSYQPILVCAPSDLLHLLCLLLTLDWPNVCVFWSQRPMVVFLCHKKNWMWTWLTVVTLEFLLSPRPPWVGVGNPVGVWANTL